MSVVDRIKERGQQLSSAERRVAEVVLTDLEAVAFGTVAELARQARTSGATVVRFANRLGYDGFVELQSVVQREMSGRLRPAGERIRQPGSADVVARTLEVELDNVRRSLLAIERSAFTRAVRTLASRRGRVAVLPGGASHGIGRQMADELAMLRPGVDLVWGPAVHVTSALAGLGAIDALVAIDLRRYDRALLDAVRRAAAGGTAVLAITDSLLSPLGRLATASFAVAAEGAGPFDSHLGALAVCDALVAGAADRLRSSATARIDGIESAWDDAGVLVDECRALGRCAWRPSRAARRTAWSPPSTTSPPTLVWRCFAPAGRRPMPLSLRARCWP
jgi:DNA-binding MurR/RpiR family transcriptional regulator